MLLFIIITNVNRSTSVCRVIISVVFTIFPAERLLTMYEKKNTITCKINKTVNAVCKNTYVYVGNAQILQRTRRKVA